MTRKAEAVIGMNKSTGLESDSDVTITLTDNPDEDAAVIRANLRALGEMMIHDIADNDDETVLLSFDIEDRREK